MADDRIQINFLERALSPDMADIQSITTRQWSELLRLLGSRKRIPSLYVDDLNDGTQSTPEPFCVGLEVTRLDANTARVHPGTLATISPSNLTADSLDSTLRLGRLRSALNVAYPVSAYVAGGYFLLSARVVKVVTQTTTREVFDVPTQTFAPQSLDKQVEHQIETRWDDPGGAGLFFPFGSLPSGDWEPLAYVALFQDTTNAFHGQVIDVRRDLRDVLRAESEDPLSQVATANSAPVVYKRALESFATPTQDSLTHFRGSFWATNRGNLYGIELPIESTATVNHPAHPVGVPAVGALAHYYLCPLVSGGKTRVPSGAFVIVAGPPTSPITRRGILVGTTIAPDRSGRNSLPITLGGSFVGLDAIPVGEAVHVLSAVAPSGGFSPLEHFTIAGSRQRGAFPALVTQAAPTLPHSSTVALDLRPVVPPNVKTVTLRLLGGMNAVANVVVTFHAKIKKDSAIIGGGGIALVSRGVGLETTYDDIVVPIFTPRSDDPFDTDPDAYLNLSMDIMGASSAGVISTIWSIHVVGWEYL